MTAARRPWTVISVVAAVVLTATVAVVAIFIFEGTQAAQPPHSNVRFDGEIMRVHAIASGDVLDAAGLEPGDGILGVNGVEFEAGGDYTEFFRSVKPGDDLAFSVRRDGRLLELSSIAKRSAGGSGLAIALVPIVVLLAVGGGVFFAGPRNPTSLLFLLYCATTAVNDAAQLAVIGGSSWIQLVMTVAYTLFSVQTPALGLHLFVLFPERRRLQKRLSLWLPLAYGIQTALGLSYLLPAYSTAFTELLDHPWIHPALLELFNANVVICSALSAISLAATAVRGRDERTRLQARLLFFAFFILTILQLALYTLPLQISSRMLVSAEAYTLLDLIVPLFVAAAVLFHRLFGIDVLVRQGFIYGVASVAVALFFAAVVFGLGWFGRRLGVHWEVVSVTAAAATAGMLFPVVQRRTKVWVDRVLYGRRESFRRLIDEISGQLGAILDLDAATMVLYRNLDRALQPGMIEILIFRPSAPAFEVVHPDGRREVVLKDDEAIEAERIFLGHASPFEPELPPRSGAELVVPLVHGERLLGAVLLGERRSGVQYLGEDLAFLGTVARLAAVAFENARLLEERRVRERLATVGSATAAIAHEIKNPLAAIKSTAAILRRRIKDDPRGQELTRVVEEETERLQHSLLDVLSFVRPPESEPIAFDLNELVEQLLTVVESDFAGAGIEVEMTMNLASSTMVGSPERLRQALINLLMNSREAMPEGGLIRVLVNPWAEERGRVGGFTIEVRDTGPGFPEELLDRVFEPLVSGKRLGTGLGLANVRRAVVDHGGEISAGNDTEGGAVVSINLPRGLITGNEREGAKPGLPRGRTE